MVGFGVVGFIIFLIGGIALLAPFRTFHLFLLPFLLFLLLPLFLLYLVPPAIILLVTSRIGQLSCFLVFGRKNAGNQLYFCCFVSRFTVRGIVYFCFLR